MIHRDPDEYVAARLTIWILAVGFAVWTLCYVIFGALADSGSSVVAPPASSYTAAAQTPTTTTQYDRTPQSLAEARGMQSQAGS
jgi:hypothetical protein